MTSHADVATPVTMHTGLLPGSTIPRVDPRSPAVTREAAKCPGS